MKKVTTLLKFICISVCCSALIISSCRKNSSLPPVVPGIPADSMNTANADTISSHLRFMNATKITGTIPQGPSGSSLKISFEDTIYLTDALIPIKFFHGDTTKNVSGAMVQIYTGGTASIYYFDVPEMPDAAENDTISTIVAGIDIEGFPEDGVPPAGGDPLEIKIVPYNEDGEALGEVIRPIQVLSPGSGSKGGCGLTGGSFFWEMSYTMHGFNNSPEKLWGMNGQDIQGCCTNGISDYTSNCAPENKRSLNFQTFFGWPRERWIFLEDGTYVGVSDYLSALPAPGESDFCGDGPGVVHENFKVSLPEGKWSVDALGQLILAGDGSNTAVNPAARPIGKIFSLHCKYLIIIQEDLETRDEDDRLYKFYMRNYPGQPRWYNIN